MRADEQAELPDRPPSSAGRGVWVLEREGRRAGNAVLFATSSASVSLQRRANAAAAAGSAS